MKLHYSTTSPYVRKVVVSALETGFNDRIERVTRAITPVNPDPELNADNPLGKVPTLVLDDGTILFDSRVICEYLDSLHDGTRLFPASGATRWDALRRQALADGILDAGVSTRYEIAVRPEQHRWGDWAAAQQGKILRACDRLETEAGSFGDNVDIGVITIGCALGYLDFRYNDWGWRDGRSALAHWYDRFVQRESMQSTMPA